MIFMFIKINANGNGLNPYAYEDIATIFPSSRYLW